MPSDAGPAAAARLARIFRHPIKGIGSEPLEAVALSPEGAVAGDRRLALLHAGGETGPGWQPRRNFLQVAAGPALARVRAAQTAEGVRLGHPDLPDLVVRSESDGPALADWVRPLWPEGRPAPARLVPSPAHGMTDSPDPFVSIGNLASLRALSQRAGRALDPRRFRINLWVEGWAPWEEFDQVGRRFAIGAVPLEGRERIVRCRAPEADPETGRRDVDVCRVLENGWDHNEFGILARVLSPGSVALGDPVGAVA